MKAVYAFLSILILTTTYALIGIVLYFLSWRAMPIFVSSVFLTMYRTRARQTTTEPEIKRQRIVMEDSPRGFGLEAIQEPGKPARLVPFRTTYSIINNRKVG